MAETAQRCVICHGSGWTGSRHASDGRYQPPGRGHRHGCEHDARTWVWGTFPDVVQPPEQAASS